MQLTRHHYLALGIVLLLLGVQFRVVQSVVLTRESSQFIAEKIEGKKKAPANPFTSMLSIPIPAQKRTIEPPRWVGWSLISVGSVLILHALAMKDPG